jgi:hypothetical protein
MLEIVHSGRGVAYAEAYGKACDRFDACNVMINRTVIDNEFPRELQQEFKNRGHTPHLVSPNLHRRVIAERAIQTVKHAILSARHFAIKSQTINKVN